MLGEHRVERSRVLPNRPPVGVRFTEHTADAAIEVRARSVEGCFARAAAGMFACFTAPSGRIARQEHVPIEVRAEGVEELMVAWLEELLFESEVKGLALHSFTVESVTEARAVGLAQGPKFGRGSTQVGPMIKAVTRHGLEVRSASGYWLARIIFDV
jgi:SHS2 domain-containing protein